MRTQTVAIILLSLAAAVGLHAENGADRVVLPFDKTDAIINLSLDAEPSKNAVWSNEPLHDLNGARIYPQPVVDIQSVTGNVLQVHLSQIYFWGAASFTVAASPGSSYTFVLQRGPFVKSTEVDVNAGIPAQVWLYTFETRSPKISWRIVSGLESVCGIDSHGLAKTDCEPAGSWGIASLGALRSDPIVFTVPKSWFHPFHNGSNPEIRNAFLELRYGAGDDAPVERIPLQLDLMEAVSMRLRKSFHHRSQVSLR